MLPASWRLLTVSKSNSSTLFPSTTTTRVSSAWVASMSIFVAMNTFRTRTAAIRLTKDDGGRVALLGRETTADAGRGRPMACPFPARLPARVSSRFCPGCRVAPCFRPRGPGGPAGRMCGLAANRSALSPPGTRRPEARQFSETDGSGRTNGAPGPTSVDISGDRREMTMAIFQPPRERPPPPGLSRSARGGAPRTKAHWPRPGQAPAGS